MSPRAFRASCPNFPPPADLSDRAERRHHISDVSIGAKKGVSGFRVPSFPYYGLIQSRHCPSLDRSVQ